MKDYEMSSRYKAECEKYYKNKQKKEDRLNKLKEKQKFKIGNEVTLIDRIYDIIEVFGLIIIVLALIALTFK